MKFIGFILGAILFAGCSSNKIEINGTAQNMDGGIASILNLSNQPVFVTGIQAGKFSFKPKNLDSTGYYTFSVMKGKYPNDFEIYLEPGKYTIDVPEKEGDYLKIKTDSKIQNELSAYYNFEDSVMYTFRHQVEVMHAALNDPRVNTLSQAGYDKLNAELNSAVLREQGASSAVMNMFVDKYPKNDIVIHVMTNMDYTTNPSAYYMIYQKLSPAAKNSEEGKVVGEKLKEALKNTKQ